MVVFAVQNGRTPLLIAAEKGHVELVRKLTGQYDGDIFHKMMVRIWKYCCYICKHLHLHTHVHSFTFRHYHICTPFLSSRTPGMPSTWQPTEATYLSCSTSVPSLETECLTGMGMVRLVWTLLAGWDDSPL